MAFSRETIHHIFAGIVIVLGLLIILTPWFIFPVCERSDSVSPSSMSGSMHMGSSGSSHMPCWYTAEAETGIGALAILAGILLILLPGRDVRRALGGIAIGIGVVAALTPIVLTGTCGNPDSACNIGTKPALILLGIVTVLVGINFILSRDEGTKVPA